MNRLRSRIIQAEDYTMAILTDVPITYLNETARYDFSVVVFCQSDKGSLQKTVVWEMLRTQTSAHFTYPAEIQVGAEWAIDGVDYRDGPFDAKFGSTWNLIQTEKDGTPLLKDGIVMHAINTIRTSLLYHIVCSLHACMHACLCYINFIMVRARSRGL